MADLETEQAARRFHVGEERPRVTHHLSAFGDRIWR
jgi:hypothetical protein